MSIQIESLDRAAQEELSNQFPDEASLPKGYDRIFLTGFKQSEGSVDLSGQIIARPSDWRTPAARSRWVYHTMTIFFQDVGGIYLRGMSFPKSKHPDPQDFDLEGNLDKVVRFKVKTGVMNLRSICEDVRTGKWEEDNFELKWKYEDHISPPQSGILIRLANKPGGIGEAALMVKLKAFIRNGGTTAAFIDEIQKSDAGSA
jgi:hypothetical protein